MSPHISFSSTANRAFCVTFFTIAQVLTIARLWLRFRKRRLWWDDGCAFLTMAISILIEVLMDDSSASGVIPISRGMLVIQLWLLMISFTVVIWCARLSLIFSIIRLIPPLFTLRKISECVAVCFVFACAGNLAPKIYICASNQNWYKEPAHSKAGLMSYKIVTGELITDVAADITLVAIPLRLLRHVSLSDDKRRMLIFVFGATLLTSLISIARIGFLVGPSKYFALLPITDEVEVGTALIVANLGVLIPVAYRLIKREKEVGSTPYSQYRSFQNNGEIRMRRVSDLVASDIICFESEPEVDLSSSRLAPSDPNSNPSSGGNTDGDEIPKPELLQSIST